MAGTLAYRIAAVVATTTFFVGFLATVLQIDPLAEVVRENRTRSGVPTASLEEMHAFVDQANAYVGDNYGFRSLLIRGHALFREHVLNANSSENVFLEMLGLGQ